MFVSAVSMGFVRRRKKVRWTTTSTATAVQALRCRTFGVSRPRMCVGAADVNFLGVNITNGHPMLSRIVRCVESWGVRVDVAGGGHPGLSAGVPIPSDEAASKSTKTL